MKRTLTALAGFGVAAAAIAAGALPVGGEESPRYKLEPFQEIAYEDSYEFKFGTGSHHESGVSTYWVTGNLPTGGWHLVAERQSVFTESFLDNKIAASEPQKEDGIATFDLLPDGQIKNLDDGHRNDALRGPLIELPKDWQTAKAGWESNWEPEVRRLYRLLPDSEPRTGKCRFSETREGLFNVVYASTSNSVIDFDPARGLVAGIETTFTQDYGFHGKGTTTVKLRSVGVVR